MDQVTPDPLAEYVEIGQLARQHRMMWSTLRRRITDAGVPVCKDPRDERRRLVRVADVERILQPRPLSSADVSR